MLKLGFISRILRTIVVSACFALALLAGPVGLARGAEITGANDADAADLARQQRRAELIGLFTGNDPDRTVIHFSVLPSLEDPTELETRVFVQRRGGQEVCIGLTAPDVITRAYRSDPGQVFDPEVPASIRMDTSSETGDLIGYNDIKLFIRPHNPAYLFETDECFTVGALGGCLIEGDLACDEILEENQEVCIGQGGIAGFCGGGIEHAQSIDSLLKLIATNALAPPVVTEAGPETTAPITDFTPDQVFSAPEIGDGTTPLPPISAPNVTDVLPLVGGGSALVQVPEVKGQTLQEATDTIVAKRLVVSGVTVDESLIPITIGSLSLIRSAHAQEPPSSQTCEAGKADRTNPPAGTFVNEFSGVLIIMCGEAVDVPEPASLLIFMTGLFLLFFAYRYRNSLRPKAK